MRDFFVKLFSDNAAGPSIELYNIWHILILLIIAGVTVALALLFKDKSKETKNKVLNIYSLIIVILYFGDFFVHPLMEDENILIVDKLPFHLCTAAGILIAITRLFPEKTKSWYHVPAVLAIIGGFLYILVPTGIAGNKLFCYRTLQTLFYHGMIITYGILAIVYGDAEINIKNIYKEGIVIAIQIVIAVIANAVYSIPEGRTDAHRYNWYFVDGGDSLGLPISKLAMPFCIFVFFMVLCLSVYGIVYLVRKLKSRKA